MSCTLLEDKERGGDELRWLSRLREAGLHPVDYRALSWLPRCSTDDLGLGCALVRPSLGAGSLLSLMASFLFTRCLRGRLEGWAAEVESWAVAHGARPLSAVVQEVPRATASGLAYTLDPVTRRRAVVVQSVPGLHLALLTRGSPHDTFLLSPDGLRVEEVRVLPKPRALTVGPSGLEEVEVRDPGAQSISDEIAVEVARLSLRAEEAIGSPVEVEWALVNNEVRLLAARPLPEELVRT